MRERERERGGRKGERERGGGRKGETDRQTERQTDRQTERKNRDRIGMQSISYPSLGGTLKEKQKNLSVRIKHGKQM